MEIDDVVYLEFNEAVWLHFELMWDFGETHIGIDRRELIESALARPKQAAHYANADIVAQAATLCFGLIKNHPVARRKQAHRNLFDEDFSENERI